MLLVACCLLLVVSDNISHPVPRTTHQDFLLDNPCKSHKCESKNSCNHQ